MRQPLPFFNKQKKTFLVNIESLFLIKKEYVMTSTDKTDKTAKGLKEEFNEEMVFFKTEKSLRKISWFLTLFAFILVSILVFTKFQNDSITNVLMTEKKYNQEQFSKLKSEIESFKSEIESLKTNELTSTIFVTNPLMLVRSIQTAAIKESAENPEVQKEIIIFKIEERLKKAIDKVSKGKAVFARDVVYNDKNIVDITTKVLKEAGLPTKHLIDYSQLVIGKNELEDFKTQIAQDILKKTSELERQVKEGLLP